MDLSSIAAGYAPRRLFDLEHAELPESAVLCGKLLAAFWLASGQVVYLRADSVPFGGVHLPFTQGAAFVNAMVLAQLFALLTILMSKFFRTGSGVLAMLIAVLAALDQALFSNNRAFVAALCLMLALGSSPLACAQAGLVYFCAAVDKLLTADWRSGWFLQTFTTDSCRVGELWSPGWSEGARLPFTCALSAQLEASSAFAVASSALVITTEFAIALGYGLRARFTAPLAVAFHCALFFVTGGTFGVFFYAGIAASLLVLDLDRMPAPFNRSWPYFALALLLVGPWVRPWFAGVFAGVVLVTSLRLRLKRA